MLLITVTI